MWKNNILEQEFSNQEILGKKDKSVLFCILRSSRTESGMINQPLYELQKALLSVKEGYNEQQEQIRVEKAIVYGSKQIDIRPFESCQIDKIYYVDIASQEVNAAHLLVISDALLTEQMEKKCGTNGIMVIVLEKDFPLEKEEVSTFLAFFGRKTLNYTIMLVETKRQNDSFEKFILNNNGRIFDFSELDQAVNFLRTC